MGGSAAALCAGCIDASEVAGEVFGDPAFTGFGSDINLGPVDQVVETIRANNGFWYRADGRMWLVEYPAEALPLAREVYGSGQIEGMEAGIVALFQKCPHLGCRVPSCETSQLFECPCHGSKYNAVGEKQGGPSPRGMDRFAVQITSDNELVVRTASVMQGPPIGTNTTNQQAQGPNCIGDPGASDNDE